jgi:hypothetical protein
MKSFLADPEFIIFHIFEGDFEPLILKIRLLNEELIEDSILEELSIGTYIVKSSLNSFPKD